MFDIKTILSIRKEDLTYEIVEIPFPEQTEYQVFTMRDEDPKKRIFKGYYFNQIEAVTEVYKQTGIGVNTRTISA